MKPRPPAGPELLGPAERSGTAHDHVRQPPDPAPGNFFFRPFILAAGLGLMGFTAGAQTPSVPGSGLSSDAANQGRQLVQKILSQAPPANSTVTGHLLIRGTGETRASIPVTCVILAGPADWESLYQADFTNRAELLWIDHAAGQANRYYQATLPAALSPEQLPAMVATAIGKRPLPASALMAPFAGSDFCVADLGLEFFHWPGQKVLKLDIHRSRGCTVLESTTPTPAPSGYARVVSWIDNETLGIVEACAYDAGGQKLKDFYPKDFKKVDGQWQVQTLVMDNARNGARSRLEFDLKK
jgi:hypothetical protein